MFWVISHCYEVIFHLWQSLSGRGEPVRERPELSVSRSDLSTFSVIHFLLWSRAREPSNLCPGPQMTRRRAAIFTLTHYPHQYFKVQARSPGSWHCWHSSPSSWQLWLLALTVAPSGDQHFALLESYQERDLQTSVKWQWVSEKRQLSCTLPRSEIITFSLTTSKMSLVNYVFCFYWPGGILSTVPKNCFLENKIKLSGII